MRFTFQVKFIQKGYAIDKYGRRLSDSKKVIDTVYAQSSEVNTNKNVKQYAHYRNTNIRRVVVRRVPTEPWNLVEIEGVEYKDVYIQSLGKRRYVLTCMEQTSVKET